MKTKVTLISLVSAIATLAISLPAQADSRRAYCKYFENGASQAKVSMPCTFSMRQGFVTITWDDGVSDYFRPIPNRSFVYTDEKMRMVKVSEFSRWRMVPSIFGVVSNFPVSISVSL